MSSSTKRMVLDFYQDFTRHELTGLQEIALTGLLVLGAFTAVMAYIRTIIWLYKWVKLSGVPPTNYGKWAVVTGATDGVGKAYAEALAKRGMNVLLISRTLSKLEAVQSDLAEKYTSQEFQVLDIDYSNFDEAARARVADKLTGLSDVGMLVNNVGMSYPFPMYFHELADEDVQNLLAINIESTVWMTRLVLPTMIQQKRGAIVNIGSISGTSSCPLLAEYSAAKMFVERFSESLSAEYKSYNIHVHSESPHYIVSKLSKIRKPNLLAPTPATYVNKSLGMLGTDAVISPYAPHALLQSLMSCLPSGLLSDRIMKMHLAVRKKGFAKRERLAGAKKDQ